jgi:DNA-binding NarL/FixJ family response regulator
MSEALRVLTPREVQALQLAAEGERYHGVAKALGLAPASVKNIWHNAEIKLGADTLTQAVAMALRRGLIT